MVRQWNSLSELCVTILSRILARGLSRIQRVTTSPSSSRSFALVAVKTFAPMAITKQDFGTKARRWDAWWRKHQDDDRVEWLFEGLAHKQSQIRALSEDELRKLTGEYFGYHYDLPRREREQARSRWQKWWYESGRARKKT